MCGRFCIAASPGDIETRFGVSVPPEYRPRYNIAPGQMILAVTGSSSHMVEWGLHTGGVKRVINTRVESAHEHPVLKELFTSHRCLIPASGYYEWKQERVRCVPYYFSSKSDPLFALAGLLRHCSSGCEAVILTTGAMPPYSEVHNRMPVLISLSDRRGYLSGGDIPPSIGLQMYQVSSRVNQVANDDPSLIEPVNPGSEQIRLDTD
ncbi:SOS response-associated peptidase [uncultured Methanospirillum sp.]|uniref:SOS response-associated peptidase n=1 Tax=uncultured Methanospirillum sp. TaxID=262503 RepID=UPI0029C95027|nr:SOS response-associated peptidase [uncultured Methanospirillum sp.]